MYYLLSLFPDTFLLIIFFFKFEVQRDRYVEIDKNLHLPVLSSTACRRAGPRQRQNADTQSGSNMWAEGPTPWATIRCFTQVHAGSMLALGAESGLKASLSAMRRACAEVSPVLCQVPIPQVLIFHVTSSLMDYFYLNPLVVWSIIRLGKHSALIWEDCAFCCYWGQIYMNALGLVGDFPEEESWSCSRCAAVYSLWLLLLRSRWRAGLLALWVSWPLPCPPW